MGNARAGGVSRKKGKKHHALNENMVLRGEQ